MELRSRTRLHPLEFKVHRRWGEPLAEARILVACSGGRDSMALLWCLQKLAPRWNARIGVAHVHHGETPDQAFAAARGQFRETVAVAADRLGLPFYTMTPASGSSVLKSEEALREFRHKCLGSLAARHDFDWIALAHHADDLLETRLIRLIRGTGPQGLPAMHERKGNLLRPFLTLPRAEIAAYATHQEVPWLEDPSNQDTEPLRNWLRQIWLPELEQKRPGAIRSLQRSLEAMANLVSHEASIDNLEQLDEKLRHSLGGLKRSAFLELEPFEQRQVLATYLNWLGVRSFGLTHIDEVRKRLQTRRKVFSFCLLGLRWAINAEQIRAEFAHPDAD